MIDAIDLMIGDWVEEKIDSIKPKINYRKVTGQDFITYGLKLEAIPLTPEILEKNGWKEMPSGTICYWDKTNKSNDIICDSGLSFSFLGRTFCPKYAHELQHALRLCGLNELADNFVIK